MESILYQPHSRAGLYLQFLFYNKYWTLLHLKSKPKAKTQSKPRKVKMYNLVSFSKSNLFNAIKANFFLIFFSSLTLYYITAQTESTPL